MLALPVAGSATGADVTFGGEAFGPARPMTGIWFSNFESSRFESCRSDGRDLLRPGESASLQCRARLCDGLDARAARAAHRGKRDPVWGSFLVRLVGRVARTAHEPRYLGDGTRTVLIERLVSVAKGETPRDGR